MFRFLLVLTLCSLWLPACLEAAEDVGATLSVRVEAVRSHKKGEVGIALFENKKGFPTHIEHSYEPAWIPVEGETAAVDHTFEGLPAGDYAVSVVHDENGNRKLERSTLGFPKEGVAFSNDQKVKLSAPDFEDCSFDLAEGENKKIVLRLDYRED